MLRLASTCGGVTEVCAPPQKAATHDVNSTANQNAGYSRSARAIAKRCAVLLRAEKKIT